MIPVVGTQKAVLLFAYTDVVQNFGGTGNLSLYSDAFRVTLPFLS